MHPPEAWKHRQIRHRRALSPANHTESNSVPPTPALAGRPFTRGLSAPASARQQSAVHLGWATAFPEGRSPVRIQARKSSRTAQPQRRPPATRSILNRPRSPDARPAVSLHPALSSAIRGSRTCACAHVHLTFDTMYLSATVHTFLRTSFSAPLPLKLELLPLRRGRICACAVLSDARASAHHVDCITAMSWDPPPFLALDNTAL
ncbi:hypothetical protein C8Q70DRAFT_196541 [Cubamyces menziesii]|nr:hypothetical protein C8Q70DRAFT_196541 [Cubamyces menziesii]